MSARDLAGALSRRSRWSRTASSSSTVPIWTSAGMTASIDLALALVERDHGIELGPRGGAQARGLSPPGRRPVAVLRARSSSSPSPTASRRRSTTPRPICASDLSVVELADVASLSPRQFSRAFHAETGQTPAKAVEHLRVEAARLMMEEGRHSMDAIADETGFADRERMRRAFLRNRRPAAADRPPQRKDRLTCPDHPRERRVFFFAVLFVVFFLVAFFFAVFFLVGFLFGGFLFRRLLLSCRFGLRLLRGGLPGALLGARRLGPFAFLGLRAGWPACPCRARSE